MDITSALFDPELGCTTFTVERIYNRVAKKGVLVKGKGGGVPMKASAALYNDFDWEITGR